MFGTKPLAPIFPQILLLVMLYAIAASTVAHAAECPPQDIPLQPVVIPGDADEKGEVFREGMDDKGNLLQQWCVMGRKNAMGEIIHGTDWGFRYTSADKKVQVWVGGCFFAAGENEHSYRAEDKNQNGIPDEFLETTWFNAQPPPGGSRDWHFFYNPGNNILTIWKTKGKWTKKFDSKEQAFVDDYVTTQVIGAQDSYPAPAHFVDLKYKGKFLEVADPGQIASGPQIVQPVFAASVISSGGLNDLSLIVVPFAGSGTETDPFQGIQTDLFPGDLFLVAGIGISGPVVTGRAAQPDFGAWVVASYNSTSVTFRVTNHVALEPGTRIDGFQFTSIAPVTGNPWILDSCSLLTTSFGSVEQGIGIPLSLGTNLGMGFEVSFAAQSRTDPNSFSSEAGLEFALRILNCN